MSEPRVSELSVWAPYAERSVEADVEGRRIAMRGEENGWWRLDVPSLRPGADYAFCLDGGEPLPDPRSRWQPGGVHGPSRMVPELTWTDSGWRGVPLAGSSIYELHIGTFTPEGTFDAAIERLPHLVDLGVDLVELLPVNAFPGRHGWGYDGVGLYAVHHPYGGPEGLARFVDAGHAHGLGVLLDVVYNHLGPAGNYLGRFGPYFTDTHVTPWGPAVNYDAKGSPEVRRFVLDNVTMWLRDYHLDGLRLDAVHAMVDTSATHLLEEIAVEVDALAAHLGRPLSLIAESDLNDPRLIGSREAGGYGLTAQWSDDLHHALHAVLTGETSGYYADFGQLDDLATALTEGFVYAGRESLHRGHGHGRRLPPALPSYRLLGYLQDHDQVGNRAQGERSAALMSEGRVKVGAALVLLSPFTPMLWMGEEWGASTPWQYFTDHDDPTLAESVRTGRRSEFAAFGWSPQDVPDPQDPATVDRSRLDWAELGREPHASLLDWHRKLLGLRRSEPAVTDPRLGRVSAWYDDEANWLVLGRGERLRVVANLSTERQSVPLDGNVVEVVLTSETGFAFRGAEIDLDGDSVAVVRITG